MKLNRIRKYKRSLKKTSWVVKGNSVIGMGLALPFVIVPTLTLKSGVAMSFIIAAATIPSAVAACLVGEKLKPCQRVPIFALLSMLCVTLAAKVIEPFPLISEALGIYIMLAAVNSMMLELSFRKPRSSVKSAILDSFRMCVGFALVACSVSALREILGNTTLWEKNFVLFPIRMQGVMLPFFGFILLGFLGAFFRSVDRYISRFLLMRDLEESARENAGKEVIDNA